MRKINWINGGILFIVIMIIAWMMSNMVDTPTVNDAQVPQTEVDEFQPKMAAFKVGEFDQDLVNPEYAMIFLLITGQQVYADSITNIDNQHYYYIPYEQSTVEKISFSSIDKFLFIKKEGK